MSSDYTVILNGYKRPENLRFQIEAVNRQTVKPTNIFYWQNSVDGVQYDQQAASSCVSAFCNANFGVWSRFAYALNTRTNWVCVFDDDTIPGSQWIENCLQTYEKHPGLLGTIGLLFIPGAGYGIKERVGWDGPRDTTTQVDIVGHSWFFHRDMLSVFFRELPPINHNYLVGEDIHFSHMIQKYTNAGTFVPPHPVSNKEMWGSLKGWELGGDKHATAGNGGIPLMYEWMQKAVSEGFKTQAELNGNV